MLRITGSFPFKSALALVDVRVLDHLVVAGAEVSSFAQRGLLQLSQGQHAPGSVLSGGRGTPREHRDAGRQGC